MDIVGLVKSTQVVDLVLIALLAVALVGGIVQGALRGLEGFVAIILAFVVAANLANPFGNFLAGNWKQLPAGYNHMLAFLIVFLLLAVGAIIGLFFLTPRTEIKPGQPAVDDAFGAFFGLVEAIVILACIVIIFRSYDMPLPFKGDIEPLHRVYDMINFDSHIAAGLRSGVAPIIVHLLAPFLPASIVALF